MSSVDSHVLQTVSDRVDLVRLHEHNPSRYPYLLQSVAQSTGQVQFDILFAFPQQRLVLQPDNRMELHAASGEVESGTSLAARLWQLPEDDFLQAFQVLWQQEQIHTDPIAGLPFCGGWFLFLGYELARQIEPSLRLPAAPSNAMPVACATRVPAAVVVNRQTGEQFIVTEPGRQDLLRAIDDDIKVLQSTSSHQSGLRQTNGTIIESINEEDAQRYLDSVGKIKHYIRDGDVFQVNLSRLWTATLNPHVTHTRLYQRLTQTNPAPFFALAVLGEHAILSSSPERLVRTVGSQIDTRPIAGTRPRGNSALNDEVYLKELIANPKERAEHIMLIDLERNDLGRVCVPGSVKVSELMALESYAHVHHIVSNVQGQLRAHTSPSDVIRAIFPGGTITGCPKVRCMQIIAELEQAPREAYTGSLGYVNHNGDMDMNILIRTLVKNRQTLSFRAGAGIVADSDPHQELLETRAKAKGLLLAL